MATKQNAKTRLAAREEKLIGQWEKRMREIESTEINKESLLKIEEQCSELGL